MNEHPRQYKYKKANVILSVGIDENGRVFSTMEKNGIVVAKDIYVRLPTEALLIQQGWLRYE